MTMTPFVQRWTMAASVGLNEHKAISDLMRGYCGQRGERLKASLIVYFQDCVLRFYWCSG